MNQKELIQAAGKCHDLESAKPYLDALDIRELSPQYFAYLGRKIGSYSDSLDVKVAYLSNFTIDLLPNYLNVHAAFRRFRCGAYMSPFNQYFQDVLTARGPLATYEPDILFLSLSMRALDPTVFYSFPELSREDRQDRLDRVIDHFRQWISSTTERYDADIIVTNFQLPSFPHLGLADAKDSFGEMQFYCELNKRLANLSTQNTRVHILDLAKLSARVGFENIYDPKLYYLAKISWSERFFSSVAEEIVRFITALKGRTKKCLVCDLDNTLWGGIVGEDGPLGVKIGQGDPISEAYFDFQTKIKSVKNRGILLAICSKNNQGDVEEVFKKRPDMPLKLSDFAATKINWDHKNINIKRLAQELNIGLDSLVFIDDNPVECELIKQTLPQVMTVRLPPKHELMVDMIDSLVELEKIVVLEDDRKKTEQYHHRKQREELKESAGDLKKYLESLGMVISMRSAQKQDLERVHQLFTKTNQFNVTTIRYAMGDIEKFCTDKLYDLTIVSCRDRFGDLGIIGLYLLDQKNNSYYIDSLILSCRAMGRGIEVAIMNRIKEEFKAANHERMEAKFIPTKKNVPVRSYFEEQGFEARKTEEDGTTYYSLKKENCRLIDCSWITINEE